MINSYAEYKFPLTTNPAKTDDEAYKIMVVRSANVIFSKRGLAEIVLPTITTKTVVNNEVFVLYCM